jgi:hypothetical protein
MSKFRSYRVAAMLVLVAALILVLPAVALAAVTLADSCPVSNFSGSDLDYIPAGTPADGQSFKAIAGTVDSASFYLKNAGCTDSVWAEVYNITGAPGSTAVPTGLPIASSAHIDASTVSGSSYNVVTFNFDNSVTLTAGNSYAIVVRRDGSSGPIYVGTSQTGTNPAAGNNMAWDNGGPWEATTLYDMLFSVYETPPAPVVSTPASSPWTLALAGLVVLAFIGFRDLRRRDLL